MVGTVLGGGEPSILVQHSGGRNSLFYLLEEAVASLPGRLLLYVSEQQKCLLTAAPSRGCQLSHALM